MKILFITLSNIGDVILTLPALDVLRESYPQAEITVVAGERPRQVFEGNSLVQKVIVYNKRWSLKENILFFQQLSRERFDIVADLRNSFFGLFLPARASTWSFLPIPKKISHMKDRHLYRLKKLKNLKPSRESQFFYSMPQEEHVSRLLASAGILPAQKLLVVSAGARSHIKRWEPESFVKLIQLLVKEPFIETAMKVNPRNVPLPGCVFPASLRGAEGDEAILSTGIASAALRPRNDRAGMLQCPQVKIVLVGDAEDQPIVQSIQDNLYRVSSIEHPASSIQDRASSIQSHPVLNLCGRLTLPQLAVLLRRAALVVTNDSAVLHLASYQNVPVAAIFGPTDEEKYGPWSSERVIVKKDIFCRPCRKAQCRYGTTACMRLVKPEDVLNLIKGMFSRRSQYPLPSPPHKGEGIRRELRIPLPLWEGLGEGENTEHRASSVKRVLITRTDRIGDVLLSTPAIKAARQAWPQAYIAVMVSAAAKDIVEGSPYIDEVIVYDKENRHKSWLSVLKLAFVLRKKKFDLAVILHPTVRVNLLAFLCAIPRRAGWDKKWGFLLTEKIPHLKQSGQKHELEYTLDALRYLGVEPADKTLFMPISAESRQWAETFLRRVGVVPQDRLVAIHPAASCPSKCWPLSGFAQAASRLADQYQAKIVIIAGPNDKQKAVLVERQIKAPVINLAGKTSISQLAAVLEKCALLISNDSGPVHVAAASGTPVISIFGRNQKGLSPARWAPVGPKDIALHKEVGCATCLAHNCQKEFACLKAITVEEVLAAAGTILQPSP